MSKASDAALKKFEERFVKTFGAGTIKDPRGILYDVIPTGSVGLDMALGCGGYIRGRLTEIWGGESSGKTTLALLGIAEAQKKYPNRNVAFIDVERTFDADWAQAHGVNLDKLVLISPESPEASEDIADMVKEIITSGAFSMLVLDSIGAMMPKKEIEKNADEHVVGSSAKVITRMVKMVALFAPQYQVAVVLINQVRAAIGGAGPMAPTTTRPGGFALRHVTTHVIRLAATTKVMSKENGQQVQIGQEVKITIAKNKVSSPARVVLVRMFNTVTDKYGPIGIERSRETFDVGKYTGAIKQSGSKYTLPNGESINSADKVLEYLEHNPQAVEEIRTEVLRLVSDDVKRDVELPGVAEGDELGQIDLSPAMDGEDEE